MCQKNPKDIIIPVTRRVKGYTGLLHTNLVLVFATPISPLLSQVR